LYGIAAAGGAYYCGAVFRLSPPSSSGGQWTEAVLYSFTGQNGDGCVGYASTPVFGSDGALYGTTAYGGTYDVGTVFELQPPTTTGGPWTESILYSFPGDVMAYGVSLLPGPEGNLYGTGPGGAYGQGMVFGLAPPQSPGAAWTEYEIYNFTGTVDGTLPQSLIAGPKGRLYGTTAFGGAFSNGVLFELSPPDKAGLAWAETTLWNFSIGIQNYSATASVSLYNDGAIFGFADTSTGLAVFELQPATGGTWTLAVLYTFPQNGTVVSSPLILRNGNLFGTTSTITGYGGQGPGGDLFELQRPTDSREPWNEIIIHHFQQRDSPHGSIVFDSNGTIYGTTVSSNAAPHQGYAYQVTLPTAN